MLRDRLERLTIVRLSVVPLSTVRPPVISLPLSGVRLFSADASGFRLYLMIRGLYAVRGMCRYPAKE